MALSYTPFAFQELPGPLAVALRQGHTSQDSKPEQGHPGAGTSRIQVWNQFEGLLRRRLRFLQAIPLIQQDSIALMRHGESQGREMVVPGERAEHVLIEPSQFA